MISAYEKYLGGYLRGFEYFKFDKYRPIKFPTKKKYYNILKFTFLGDFERSTLSDDLYKHLQNQQFQQCKMAAYVFLLVNQA